MISLETAFVVPLVIGLTVWSLNLAEPGYSQTRMAARLEVLAACERVSGKLLYRAGRLSEGEAWTTGVQASPQIVLEAASLFRLYADKAGRLLPAVDP